MEIYDGETIERIARREFPHVRFHTILFQSAPPEFVDADQVAMARPEWLFELNEWLKSRSGKRALWFAHQVAKRKQRRPWKYS